MDSILINIAVVIIGALGIVYLGYCIWCARRREAALEIASPYFGKWGARLYVVSTMFVFWAAPGGFIVGVVAVFTGNLSVSMFFIALLFYGVVIFTPCFFYRRHFIKKMLRLGGIENLKAIKKLAWIIELGGAFKRVVIIASVVSVVVLLDYLISRYGFIQRKKED